MHRYLSSTTTVSHWLFERLRRPLAALSLVCIGISCVSSAMAGGYVDGNVVLNPARAINTGGSTVTPTFNNDQFNDRLLVGTVNNDPIRTPSTADPVSTVSGNNYHDETDLVIRGRNGLNYAFTRTYNSASSSTSVDRGLGFGWTHSYNMKLRSNDYGNCPNCDAFKSLNTNPDHVRMRNYSNMCIKAGINNQLVVESCSDTYLVDEYWQFNSNGTIVSAKNGACINVMNDGVSINYTTCNGLINQKWAYSDSGDALIWDKVYPAPIKGQPFAGYSCLSTTNATSLMSCFGTIAGKWQNYYIVKDSALQIALENGDSVTSSIAYVDERGGEQNYLVNETSYAVTSPKGVYDALQFNTPVTGQHTIIFRSGVKYIFETPTGDIRTTPNVTARLKYIDNAWGDRLTLTYDANGRLSTVIDNLGITGRTGLVFAYNADGRLQSVADWTGRHLDFTYDAVGNLQTRTNPLGEVLTYGYDVPHLLTTITQPLARDGMAVQTRFKYYENGRAFQQTNSFGQGDTLDYDLYRKSTRVTDVRGFVREYSYDDNGRMTKLVEPDGAVLLFENQGDAIRSKKYDALGYATTYSYRNDRTYTGSSDAYGQVTRELDALNRTVDYTYGPFDQLATIKDKRGAVITTGYAATTSGCDVANRPRETRISTLSGATNVLLSSQCWNANGTLNYQRSYIDTSRYTETRLTYETGSNGLNVSQAQRVGMPSGVTITQTYTYDNLGRKKTETLSRRTSPTNSAPIDLTTNYDYDALDRVIKITDSLGNESINRYDANGQLWQVTHRYLKPDATYDVRNVMTRTFDAVDRVKTETNAADQATSYSYDEAGNVIAVLDAEGHTVRFEYDPMNRKTAVVGATGYRTETDYNQRGDIMAIRNANNETVRFEYDALGRKTAQIDNLGYRTEYQYDENGNITCAIDANAQASLQPKNTYGCSEYRQYDEMNRVVNIVDALNNVTGFSYDLQGNRLSITDAESKIWRFVYDDLGRLTGETDHSSRGISYQQDEAGNVWEKTNRLSEVIRNTFDNANRLVRVDYLKDGSNETFSYDPAGNRNAAVNSNVSYTFGYDNLNRLTSKIDSRGKSLGFNYDRVGNLLSKTTYQNSTTYYTYDAANRLVQLENPDYLQVDYQYDPAGRMLSRVTSAGARTAYEYYANGMRKRLSQYDALNNILSDTSYTPDRVGNILNETNATATINYSYDALYRLQTADHTGTVNDEMFAYDKVGNRKTYTRGSLTANANTRYYNYTVGTNRLNEIRIGSAIGTLETSYSYDNEGHLISQTGLNPKTITWDAKGHVKTLARNMTTETYKYDPMDYRIGRSGGELGGLDYYLEGEHLESVYAGTNLEAKFFRGSSIDELVAGYLFDTDYRLKPYLFHHDNVNSTTVVSGHNGGAIQTNSYGSFGNTLATTGASPNRLKYTGREDDGTGLYYYRARYYDPAIGRFISEDPLGFGAGINFYAYVDNNPVNANDPMGEEKQFLLNAGMTAFLGMYGGGPGAGGSLQIGLLGVSLPDCMCLAGWRDVQVFIGAQETGMLGFGTYAAAEFDVAMGFTDGPLPVGPSTSVSAHTEVNGGLGRTFGVGYDVNNESSQISGVNDLLGVDIKGGAGAGLMWGFGASYSQTVASPTLGSVVDWVSDDFSDAINGIGNIFSNSASGGFVLYPNRPNTNMIHNVYSK